MLINRIAIIAGKLQIGKITDVVMLLRRDNKKFSDSQKLAPMMDVIAFNARQILTWRSPTLYLFVHNVDRENIIGALPFSHQIGIIPLKVYEE